MDPDGEVLIRLRTADGTGEVRVSAEKVSAASSVLKHMIQDAQAEALKSSPAFRMSVQSPVHVPLPEGYDGEILVLLFLMHGDPDECVSLTYGDDGRTGQAVIRLKAHSPLEILITFDLAELSLLADKYRCSPVMYPLYEINLRGVDGMVRLSLLAKASLRYDSGNEDRFLELTGKMLSLNKASELDDLMNARLRDLLKSKKLELFEIRRSVELAQWECLRDLHHVGANITYRLLNPTEGQKGQCTPATRLDLLLKIFHDAEELASKYELALDKVKDRNIYQKALSEVSDLHPHECEGRILDCPLTWALDSLFMHSCYWTETPKGVSLREFRAKNGGNIWRNRR